MKNQKGQSTVLIVLALLVVGLCVGGVILLSLYNQPYNAKQDVDKSWGNVQVMMQRRYDVLTGQNPVVVAAQRQELAVYAELRKQAEGLNGYANRPAPTTPADQQAFQNQLAGFDKALVDFRAYVASNPQQVSIQAVNAFIVEIEGSNNRVATSLRDYNDAVRTFKGVTGNPPGSFFAGMRGISPNDYRYYEATTAAQTSPTPSFPNFSPTTGP